MSFKGIMAGVCVLVLCLGVSFTSHGQTRQGSPAQGQGQTSPAQGTTAIPSPQDALQGAGKGNSGRTTTADPTRDLGTFQRGVSMANNAAARLCQAGQQAYCGISLTVGNQAQGAGGNR